MQPMFMIKSNMSKRFGPSNYLISSFCKLLSEVEIILFLIYKYSMEIKCTQ